MAVLFWYFVKSDASVTLLSTFYKVPEQHDHVKLVTLYSKLAVSPCQQYFLAIVMGAGG